MKNICFDITFHTKIKLDEKKWQILNVKCLSVTFRRENYVKEELFGLYNDVIT